MTDLRADSMTGEQWVLEERSADPPSTVEGERWLRTDLNSGDKIATLRVDVGSSIRDVPIFKTGTAVDTVSEAMRVQVNGTTGYVPIAPVSETAFPELRMQHNSEIYAFHDRVGPGSAILDSVVSRPNDDDFAEGATQSGGVVVNFNGDFSQFGFNISNNTEGAARARLFDYSQGSYVLSVDISNRSAGDPVVFEYDVVGGVDYGIELDANGGSYQLGYLSSSRGSTYTSQDVDIVSVSVDGSQSSIDSHQNVNDIGSTGL